MTPVPNASWATPTLGAGTVTTEHLNLTRSLADVWTTRVVAADGRWLHKDGTSLTLVKADAWVGTIAEAAAMGHVSP